MAKMLTIEKRVFFVEEVFCDGRKFTENMRLKFRLRFPDLRCPHRDTVRDLISKFCATGSVHDAPRNGMPTILTEWKLDDISDIMLRSLTKSVRK